MTVSLPFRARALLLALALAVALPAVATPAAAQSAHRRAPEDQAPLTRAMQRYRDARSVIVAFTQTVTNPLTQRTMSSRGELRRKRPNLLSIAFTSPASDRIVADGSSLWVYLPSSAPGQVLKFPAAGAQGILLDPLGQILSTPLEQYTVTSEGAATVSGHATHAFTLVPRAAHALFTRATVWVEDSGLVRQLEATEPSGLVRRIDVTSFRTDVAVPASAFRFTPPDGVRVVDQASALRG
jgi:outer membrane lipoprotein carrier protein